MQILSIANYLYSISYIKNSQYTVELAYNSYLEIMCKKELDPPYKMK